MKELKKEEMAKVKCDFCGKQIECPKDMLNLKKHVCFECFKKNQEKLMKLGIKKVYVDIPMEKMDEMMPTALMGMMMEEVFPKIWKQEKKKFKTMSKQELAETMFAVGAETMLKTMIEMREELPEEPIDLPTSS